LFSHYFEVKSGNRTNCDMARLHNFLSSGIGPTLFIMFACDLKPIDSLNYLLKYADDSTLICPEKSVVSVEDEMANLVRWSTENKLVINLLKTKEMVFHRPNPRHFIPPPLFC
jgi:hypothetical protein